MQNAHKKLKQTIFGLFMITLLLVSCASADLGSQPKGRILLVELFGEQSEIMLLDLSDNSITRLTNNDFSDYDPVFSPGGKQVAYISEEHGLGELYMMKIDGTGQKRLTFDEKTTWSPAWSPDGTQIAFDAGDIFILNLQSEIVIQVTDLEGYQCCPVWLPDGKRLAFSSEHHDPYGWFVWDVYVLDLNTGEIDRIIDHPASDSIEDWSPIDDQILISSSRDVDDPLRKDKLYIYDLETNETRALFPDNGDSEFGPNEGQAVWSPDGNWIALSINGSMCIVNNQGNIWECFGEKYQYSPWDWAW